MAQGKWEACLNEYTSMACNVAKENSEQKKDCEETKICLQKGYDKPLSSNLWDAFGGSLKETAGIATVVALLGFYTAQ
jgi:hypothetical protein